MKLKRFENFDLETLKPSKPITRDDLMGKPCEYISSKFEVLYAVEFVPSGTFGAINNSRDYLKEMDYNIGVMQGDNPIGFVTRNKGFEYIAKWDTIRYDEYKHFRLQHYLLDYSYQSHLYPP